MTRPDRLADADRASLDAILAVSPGLAAVTASTRAFAAIMNERRGRRQLEARRPSSISARPRRRTDSPVRGTMASSSLVSSPRNSGSGSNRPRGGPGGSSPYRSRQSRPRNASSLPSLYSTDSHSSSPGSWPGVPQSLAELGLEHPHLLVVFAPGELFQGVKMVVLRVEVGCRDGDERRERAVRVPLSVKRCHYRSPYSGVAPYRRCPATARCASARTRCCRGWSRGLPAWRVGEAGPSAAPGQGR
jgi:hypothetical protein